MASKGTALVTGASGGIGADLARELARSGFDLILVARSEGKLEDLGEELAKAHGISFHVLTSDLAAPDAAKKLVDELASRKLQVDVLVNNAGYALFGAFTETDAVDEAKMIQLNIMALTQLSKLLLPGMVERKSGRIMNVASTAAFQPGPLMAVHYATKAYVLSFSEAIAEELRGSGVSVTALCPGPTKSGFQARAKMEESKLVKGKAIMDSATVARAGVEGLLAGKAVVIPGAKNYWLAQSVRFMPRSVVVRAVKQAQEREGH
ncbi:MAG: SDR family oxidoreductase [Deltaproteobacteria bacterium]|nr:SDR family oxidoreductase [Deltaproteobacteria bacterium]